LSILTSGSTTTPPSARSAASSSDEKNDYGSRSQRGTELAAVFYSLIECAKLVGVEPAEYLRRAADAALAGGAPIVPVDLARAHQ